MSEEMEKKLRKAKYTTENELLIKKQNKDETIKEEKDKSENIESKTEKKEQSNIIETLTRPAKKTYTPLRVEDDIMDMFRQYVRDNNLMSHGIVMNKVLREFIKDKV